VESENKSFDAYLDLKFFLEDLFDMKVDLVLADALKPRLRDLIARPAAPGGAGAAAGGRLPAWPLRGPFLPPDFP